MRVDQAGVAAPRRRRRDRGRAGRAATADARLRPAATRVDELPEQIVDQRLEHLAMRRRHVAPGEHLARRLVAPHLDDVGVDPDLVAASSSTKDASEREPGDVERRGRRQRDALGRRGQVVLAHAGALEVHPHASCRRRATARASGAGPAAAPNSRRDRRQRISTPARCASSRAQRSSVRVPR